MAKVRCENVSEGLRASEALASLRDYGGRRHFIRVERDFLSEQGGRFYLPVGVVHVDPRTKAVLIELPHEAETGANRLWVAEEQLDEPVGAQA
ncbi:MAG TPA: hypothetical protein VIL46_12810 [Gemmataceae bacterium]